MKDRTGAQGDVNLTLLLGRMSCHLDQLNNQLEAIEVALAQQSRTMAGLGEHSVIRLQGLDLVRQALADLGEITAHFGASDMAEAIWLPHAQNLEKVLKLKASRDLLCLAQPVPPASDGTATGDLDLF